MNSIVLPGLKRLCVTGAACLVALFTLHSTASAQTVTFSLTGSAGGGNQGRGIAGTGSGTVTPGGAATVSFTGLASNNDKCDGTLQFNLTVSLPNGDNFVTLFTAPSSNAEGTSFTLNGPLLVTGGKRTYANIGGTGTATFQVVQSQVVQSADKSFTFTMTGSVTFGGVLLPKANVPPSGITSVFSDRALISPGVWASVFGTNLANSTVSWNGDFPTSLGNVTATVDGKAAYFWFVSAGQINLQVPDGTRTGCVPFVLNTPNGTVTTQVEVQAAGPSLSMLDGKYLAAVILTPNGSGAYGNGSYDIAGPVGRFPYKTRPAKRGENVVLYGVGFGPTNPAVPAGKAYSGAANTTLQVGVNIRTGPNSFINVPLTFAGLVAAGLYQFNITVPDNAPLGDVVIQAFQAGLGTQGFPTCLTIGP